MFDILLDEEIQRDELYDTDDWLRELLRKEQKNTLKQVVEWGNETCTEHNRLYDDFPKRKCPKCWQELKKEAKK